MRVCHIISGDLWAGAEVMAYNLLKGLMRYSDIETSVILLNKGRLAREIHALGVHVDLVDETEHSFHWILWQIRKILNLKSPAVVHSHRYKENILAYLASKTGKGFKMVSTQHGMVEMFEKKDLKNDLVKKLNFSLLSSCFQGVVAVSEEIRETFLTEHRFPGGRVRVIHNGIEVPEQPEVREDRDCLVVGSSGRLFPVKDYSLMVETARNVCERTDGVRFELAGEGPERAKIEDLSSRYGLNGKFILRGFIDDVENFYQGIDIYICTSFHEGVPMSVLEAMSHGLPVVAPKVGGLREMIRDGVEGYLVDGRNPEDFARKCLLLAGNRELRSRISKAARQRVMREFSLEETARRYRELYLELAAGGTRN